MRLEEALHREYSILRTPDGVHGDSTRYQYGVFVPSTEHSVYGVEEGILYLRQTAQVRLSPPMLVPLISTYIYDGLTDFYSVSGKKDTPYRVYGKDDDDELARESGY